nr:hypothetical protein [Lysinibacillus timonensis]
MTNWALSKKVVLVSLLIAIISLFFTWVDAGFFSVNGFQQQGWIFLVLFIYPAMCAFKGKQINKIGGFVLSLIGIIGMIAYIMSKTADVFGESINLASTGMYVMLISFVVLAVGVYMDNK